MALKDLLGNSPEPKPEVETQPPTKSSANEVDSILSKEKFRFTKKVKIYLRMKDLVASRKRDVEMISSEPTLTKRHACTKNFNPAPTEVSWMSSGRMRRKLILSL